VLNARKTDFTPKKHFPPLDAFPLSPFEVKSVPYPIFFCDRSSLWEIPSTFSWRTIFHRQAYAMFMD